MSVSPPRPALSVARALSGVRKLSRADAAYVFSFAVLLLGAVWALTHAPALLERE